MKLTDLPDCLLHIVFGYVWQLVVDVTDKGFAQKEPIRLISTCRRFRRLILDSRGPSLWLTIRVRGLDVLTQLRRTFTKELFGHILGVDVLQSRRRLDDLTSLVNLGVLEVVLSVWKRLATSQALLNRLIKLKITFGDEFEPPLVAVQNHGPLPILRCLSLGNAYMFRTSTLREDSPFLYELKIVHVYMDSIDRSLCLPQRMDLLQVGSAHGLRLDVLPDTAIKKVRLDYVHEYDPDPSYLHVKSTFPITTHSLLSMGIHHELPLSIFRVFQVVPQ